MREQGWLSDFISIIYKQLFEAFPNIRSSDAGTFAKYEKTESPHREIDQDSDDGNRDHQ
jgi:hypothetical protein